jgi:hypothetical protein
MWIAGIQARIWNFTGPYGFGDMDMLGAFSVREGVNGRGWTRFIDDCGTADTF